jgi:hypothetical protein
MYDIIGDLHGNYDLLVRLLSKLGYHSKAKTYVHPERQAIFVGDIINRGDKIRATVRLVRRMVEAGSAQVVLGNHELNAILYSTLDKSGKQIRKQLPRYRMPLLQTLEQYTSFKDEWADTVKWFRTLPIYLQLDGIRVVHGAWNENYISTFEKHKGENNKLKKSLLKEYLINPELNEAINGLIRGYELELPKDLVLRDSKGISHRRFRIKWWEDAQGKTFRDISFGNRFVLPAYTVPSEVVPSIVSYPDDAPPVFLGHYCLDRDELLARHNIFCVDNCVARTHRLVAYRWQGEKELTTEHLVEVGR